MSLLRPLRRRTAEKVPQITVVFWVIKLLTTAQGEATSDFLVHHLNPYVAVAAGLAGFLAAMALQLAAVRYVPVVYWLAVVMVAVFGTMAADALHVGLGVPYVVTTVGFAVALALAFTAWHAMERTVDIHSIVTLRRELFYWTAVVATFALGTAAGDWTAFGLHLGFVASIGLFAAVIAVPAVGYFALGWNQVVSFWFAYVVTRPLGASVADYLDFPRRVGGLGVGPAVVAVTFSLAIVALVAYLSMTYSRPPARRAAAPAGRRAVGSASGRPGS